MWSANSLAEAFGLWLSNRLERSKNSWFESAIAAFDDWLNLRYLSDRLQHEQRAINEHVGDVRKLAIGPQNLISIITPVYGIKLSYIKKFIRSIQQQSYNNWELCICIDGDPDARVRKYLHQLNVREPSRYRLIEHSNNQGICAATESALTLACGVIIAFVDADDILHKSALAAVAQSFQIDSKVDIVYTNNDIITPWGYRIDPLYKPTWSPELLLGCMYVMHLVAIRKELLDRCDELWSADVQGAQDWDMMLRVTKLTQQVHHIPIVLYHWRALEYSTASTAVAKPWANQAAMKVQDTSLSSIDDRLYWDRDDDTQPGLIRLKKAIPLIALHIKTTVDTNNSIESNPGQYLDELSYDGDILPETIEISGSLIQQAQSLDNYICEECDEDSFILFICEDDNGAKLSGPVDALLAYAIMDQIACVWPFYNCWRGIYTINDNTLQQRFGQSSFFTPWSSNVLTGPLHGLLTSRKTLDKVGGFNECCSGVPLPQPLGALGALLGLNVLKHGLRNVAVRNVTCDCQLPTLDLGSVIPSYDPYI